MEIRFHTVRAHLRGAPPEQMKVLFDGNEGNKHREIFEQAALDSSYDSVAIFEHVTPRMVVHPAPPPTLAGEPPAAEVKPPPIEAEAPAPEPEAAHYGHKGKSRKW